MKRFIEGADREQSTLLPESPDDWIDDSNPVRAVDVFVDGLNLIKLRNGHIAEYGPSNSGRHPLQPVFTRPRPKGDLHRGNDCLLLIREAQTGWSRDFGWDDIR